MHTDAYTWNNEWRKTLSSQGTCKLHTLNTCRHALSSPAPWWQGAFLGDIHILKHALPMIRADTHAEASCALHTCLHMKIHAQLSSCANTCKHKLNSPYRPTNADKCWAVWKPNMQTHGDLLDTRQECRYMFLSLCVCADMGIHLQPRHKQIHNMTSPNACWYVPSFR